MSRAESGENDRQEDAREKLKQSTLLLMSMTERSALARGAPAAQAKFDEHFLAAIFEIFEEQFRKWAIGRGTSMTAEDLQDVARDAVLTVRKDRFENEPAALRQVKKLKNYMLKCCWTEVKSRLRDASRHRLGLKKNLGLREKAGLRPFGDELTPADEDDFLIRATTASRALALLGRRIFSAAAEFESKVNARYFKIAIAVYPQLVELRESDFTAIPDGKCRTHSEVAVELAVSEDTVARAISWFCHWVRDLAEGIEYESDDRIELGDLEFLKALECTRKELKPQ